MCVALKKFLLLNSMSTPLIIPAILTNSFAELQKQIHRFESLAPYVQLDIMDGSFVKTTSFTEIDSLASVATDLKYELHLMVNDPLDYITRFEKISNVFRVIIHVESKNVAEAITAARGNCWQVGLALNPETPLLAIAPYTKLVDVVQFMTVHPGIQGAPFEPSVLPKINEFTEQPVRPLCSADGAISEKTIGELRRAGVDIFNVGSALKNADNLTHTIQTLRNLCTI